jgi:predicted nucleic acid-binding protein
MTVVVDTNVLVDVLRGLPAAVAALERHAADLVVVPSMVRFEVLAGARPSERAATAALLDACLDAPVDRSVADEAAELARRFRRSHSGIDPIDYVVAATTRLLGAELLTRNGKHFPMFPRLRAPY